MGYLIFKVTINLFYQHKLLPKTKMVWMVKVSHPLQITMLALTLASTIPHQINDMWKLTFASS